MKEKTEGGGKARFDRGEIGRGGKGREGEDITEKTSILKKSKRKTKQNQQKQNMGAKKRSQYGVCFQISHILVILLKQLKFNQLF